MYITYLNPPRARQITFDEIISGVMDSSQLKYIGDNTSTVTVSRKDLNDRLRRITDVPRMVADIAAFNQKYAELEHENLSTHYTHYDIPKRTGGLRPIDAPDKVLSDALIELRDLLKSFMIADYHTAAHAYVQNRSTLTAVKKHQDGHIITRIDPETGEHKQVVYQNNWAVKFDFHGFFPSSTPEFVFRMFRQIYPFALIMKSEYGCRQLKTAMKLCFLNGGLPQGTPMSPWLTNVMMIPFDHLLSRKLDRFRMKDGISRTFTYTRYADDITISCYLSFDPMEMQDVIKGILNLIEAPFTLNEEKTHYGNRHSSKNWILGLMWNKDNDITVGWRNIKTFKTLMLNYVACRKAGHGWDIDEIQQFNGRISYYRMVEKDQIDYLISRFNSRYHVDLMAMIKEDLRPKESVA